MKKILLIVFLIVNICFGDNNVKSNKNQEGNIIHNSIESSTSIEDELLSILVTFKKNIFENNEKDDVSLEKTDYIKNIINFIKKQKYNLILGQDLENKINEINFRIETNQRYGYDLAIKRDQIKISTISNRILFYQLINDIISARNSFVNQIELKKLIEEKYASFEANDIKTYAEDYYKINSKEDQENLGTVEKKYKEYYEQYYQEKSLYLYITKYLANNTNLIYQSNFIKEKINLQFLKESINSNINNIEVINNINHFIKYSTNITIADILIALLAAAFIYVLRFILLPIMTNLLTNKFDQVNDKNSKMKDYLVKSFEKPLKYLLLVLGFDVFISILHNNQFNISILNSTFNSFYVFCVIWILYNLLDEGIDNYSEDIFEKYPNLRKEMVLFTKRIIMGLLIISFISITLSNFGVNLMALAGGLGVLGIGVGLAFKDVFGHFFGSIMILIYKPFSPGDWIVYDGGEGTVIEINMRGTRIRTFANAEIMVPNSSLANNTILNWSKRTFGRRIKMDIGITYESPKEGFKQLIIDLREMLEKHPEIANESSTFEGKTRKEKARLIKIEDDVGIKKTLFVHFTEYGNSAKIINIYCFSKSIDWEKWRYVQEDVLFKIEELVYKNKCEFAYNTVKTHVSFDDNYMELQQKQSKKH